MTATADPPWVLDHAPYTPYLDPRTARRPGLLPLDMDTWTVRLPDFDAQMVRRHEILRDHPEIAIASRHEAEEPVLELLSMLKAHLGLDPAITHLEEYCAWTAIAHLVAEDFCLLLPDADSGEYKLIGAILCFPSRWLLSEKMNRPMTIIHDPVPDYDEMLARRVNRVFEVLHEDRPLVRINWLVHPTPELFLPLGLSDKTMQQVPVGGPLYLRTERQTLVRLPESRAVAFGIKTSVCPLRCLTPEQAQGLHDALAAEEDDILKYRGGSTRDHARQVLSEVAGA
ncbi:MAG: DUF3445 domain-containing protein [Pseudomonadota bacterium]